MQALGDDDVRIIVYTGVGALSEEQVREAVKAAKSLEEMGFLVTVEPVAASWDVEGSWLGPLAPRLPVVEVNGVMVAEGRLASAMEIVSEALRSFAERRTGNPVPIHAMRGDEGEVSVSLALN